MIMCKTEYIQKVNNRDVFYMWELLIRWWAYWYENMNPLDKN